MQQQMGMAAQAVWAYLTTPEAVSWGLVALIVVLCAWDGYRRRQNLFKVLRGLREHPNRWLEHVRTYLARRELRMHRKRLLALKERAAGALIDWLMYSVNKGEMTLDESYDLQRTLATSIAYPAMAPKYEPEFVKNQIKARRLRGDNRPVLLPDSNKRGLLRAKLHGAK